MPWRRIPAFLGKGGHTARHRQTRLIMNSFANRMHQMKGQTVGVEPPSIRKVVPVMKSLSGLAR